MHISTEHSVRVGKEIMAEGYAVQSHVCNALDVLATKVNAVEEIVALHI